MAKILIVDDRAINRQFLVTLLSYTGHQLLEASNGAEALDLAYMEHPDLVITDIMMPMMDGYEFTQQVRADPVIAQTPVIFYTATYRVSQARSLADQCGVKQVLPKPSEPETILRIVTEQLAGRTPTVQGLQPSDGDQPDLISKKLNQHLINIQTLNQQMTALIELGLDLVSYTDPEPLFELFVEGTRTIFRSAYAELNVLAADGQALRCRLTSSQEADPKPPALYLPTWLQVFDKLLKEQCPYRASRKKNDLPAPGPLSALHPIQSILIIPLLSPTQLHGWLYLVNKIDADEFSQQDERMLMMVAAQMAMAYENLLRYQQIQVHAARVQQEMAHRQQVENQFRDLLESAPDAMVIIDEAGKIVLVNAQAERLFGYNRQALIGRPIEILIPARFRDQHRRHRLAYVADPQVRPMGARLELFAQHQDGSEFPVEISLSPLITEAHVLVSSAVRDITERKQAEENRLHLEAQLRQSQKLQAIGTLAGGIAHDFNNILTAIVGHTDLAFKKLPADHPAWLNLGEIDKASMRATDLVRHILAFSRQQEDQRTVLKLQPIVEEALKLLRATLPTMIQIQIQFAAGVPDVLADGTQVHQILMNLGTNAAHAMGNRPGLLEVSLVTVTINTELAHRSTELREGCYVRLTISDNGCGMDNAMLERIFEPFFTTKRPGEGTGLGLSVVHGIMKSHQGVITVNSQPGQGTTFQLYFPAVTKAASEVQPVPPEIVQGHGEHILYIDDEEALVILATQILNNLGYRVTGYTDTDQALQAFRLQASEFDAVVTDLSMVGMSGLELARNFRQVRSDMPIIITSGYFRREDQEAAQQLGIDALIHKPNTTQDLGKILHRLLTK